VGRRRLLANPATDVDWGGLETVAVADVEGTVGTVLESEVHQSATDFDAISRPVIAVAPDGSVTELSYNEAGRLDTVQVNQELYVRELDYDAKGQRRFIVYGNFVRTRYTYDKLSYRLTRLETFRSNAPNQPLQDLSYTYDPVGNVVEIRDHAQQTHFYAGLMTQPVTRYAYDPLYRLVSASGREHDSLQSGHTDPAFGKPIAHPNDANKLRPYTQTYAYDPSGNLTQMQHSAGPTGSWTRTCLYAVNSNRLLEAGGSFGYDAHGNMTGMPHLPGSLGWDHADRLFTVHMLGGGTGRYTYDNTGQRIRKTLVRNGGLVEERVYLGPFEIHRRSQAGTETFRRNTLHVMDDQSRIALIETDTGSNATRVRYQFGNHLGSCALEVDNSVAAKIISYEEYHPFGTTSAWLGANDIEASERRYRYTGKEKDEETALYYHGARYYAPWLGRWTAADPVGMKAGTNVYAYVRNNPVRLHDPSGTDGKKPPVWHEVLTEDKGAKYYMREDAGAYGRETGQFREAWVDYGPQEVQFKGGVIIGSRSKPITKAEAEKKVDPKEVAKEWAKEEMAKKALEEAQRKVDEALEEAARQAEEEEAAKAEKEGMLDSLQTTLDVAGLVPGFGEVADVLNAGVSLARGDYTGAAMSLAAAVPLAGGVAAAAKLTRKAFKAHAHAERTIKAAELINKGVKLAGKEADAAEDAAALLRSGLSKSEAGSFYHEAVGLAGSGGGADLVGKGWQKEVKTHFGPMYDWQFKSVEPQSQWYSHVYSHANRAPDGSPLYPIRIVEQVYIDPTTGFGIKFMY
jgi:RHS repeat-associated protein